MKPLKRPLLLLLAIGLCGAMTYAWFYYFEKVSRPEPYSSKIAAQDPWLAAGRFLRKEGYTVDSKPLIVLGDHWDAGVLLIAHNSAQVSKEQAESLLNWVQRGGLLIMQAEYAPDNKVDRAADVSPITARFDTWLQDDPVVKSPKKKPLAEADKDEDASDELKEMMGSCKMEQTSSVQPPALTYPLQLEARSVHLASGPKAPDSLWPASNNALVRVYAHGRGKVVLLNDEPFDNYGDYSLRLHDHAEFLLSLVKLQPGKAKVWLVQDLDIPKWYQVLWLQMPMGLLSLALALLMVLWFNLHRFGPLLAPPDPERKALLEHIDASGRWLWHSEAGRAQLLDNTRKALIHCLGRRNPALLSLSASALAEHLGEASSLDRIQLTAALVAPAATHPHDFSLQIQTLQRLRLYDPAATNRTPALSPTNMPVSDNPITSKPRASP